MREIFIIERYTIAIYVENNKTYKKIIDLKMEDLPDEKLCEIIENLTDYTDIQHLSQVDKRLYTLTSLCVRDILTPARNIPIDSIIRFQKLRSIQPTITIMTLGDLMYIASFPYLHMATFSPLMGHGPIDISGDVEWVLAFIYQYCNGLNLLDPSLGRLNRNLLGKNFGLFFHHYYVLADGVFRVLDDDLKLPIISALDETGSLRGVQIGTYDNTLHESTIRRLFAYENISILEYESSYYSFNDITADYLIELINHLPIESIIDTAIDLYDPTNNRFLLDHRITSVNTIRIIRAPLFVSDLEELVNKYPNLQEACLYISGKHDIGSLLISKTHNEIIEILQQILQDYPNIQICLKAYDSQTLDEFLEVFRNNGGDFSKILLHERHNPYE